MLGEKRTISLWQQRSRRLLALERALVVDRVDVQPSGMAATEQMMVGLKAAQRRMMAAKRKTRNPGGQADF